MKMERGICQLLLYRVSGVRTCSGKRACYLCVLGTLKRSQLSYLSAAFNPWWAEVAVTSKNVLQRGGGSCTRGFHLQFLNELTAREAENLTSWNRTAHGDKDDNDVLEGSEMGKVMNLLAEDRVEQISNISDRSRR